MMRWERADAATEIPIATQVTKIETISETKYRIFLDNKFAFVLYKGELLHYQIKENEEIDVSVYQEIKQKVILKRAKLRALHLLNDMDRTEGQLREKLKANQYTDDIIDETLKYVKSFGYVNDTEYARSFILNRKDKKSKKELYMLLTQKGLPTEVLDEVFEEVYDDESSKEAICKILKKKNFDPETADRIQTQKMLAYLTRKGFSYDDIRQVLQA